ITETVVYHSSTVTVAPSDPKTTTDSIDPNDPNSIKYPAGIDDSDLNETVTQTIHYLDDNGNEIASDHVQTLHFARTATVDYSTLTSEGQPTVTYSDWTATDGDTFTSVASPVIDDMTTDQATVAAMVDSYPAPVDLDVFYVATKQEVTPSNPHEPGTLVNPNDPAGPKWPSGVTSSDLTKTVTQVIHYVDENGNSVAPDHTATLQYTRTAIVDFSNPDNPTVTYGPWVAVNGNETFASVTSPSIDGMNPSQSIVSAVKDDNAESSEITVVYHANAVASSNTQSTTPETSNVTPAVKLVTKVSNTNTISVPNKSSQPTKSSQNKLPQTGDSHSDASMIGWLMLEANVLILAFGIKRRKRDED
ncbi:mucin-binding protein, partial [Paucilactobacillus suebicus]